MMSLIGLISTVITLYSYCLLATVIISWLIAFNVVNLHNRFVFTLNDILNRLTEPALRPIRNVIPSIGGIDLSPIILFLLLSFANSLLWEYGPRLAH